MAGQGQGDAGPFSGGVAAVPVLVVAAMVCFSTWLWGVTFSFIPGWRIPESIKIL